VPLRSAHNRSRRSTLDPKITVRTLLLNLPRIFWGVFLLLTSIYCVLAFLPYTYFALIKAPAYPWMPWFAQHYAWVYWGALLGFASGQHYSTAGRTTNSSANQRFGILIIGSLALAGIYVAARPFMPTLQNNWTAFLWSLVALLPLTITAAIEVYKHWPARDQEGPVDSLLCYRNAIWIGAFVALIYVVAAEVKDYVDTRVVQVDLAKLQLAGWSLFSHILLAIIVVSVLNLIRIVTKGVRRPTTLRLALHGILSALIIGRAIDRFLAGALSFDGGPAHIYAALFASAVTLFGASLLLPFVDRASVISAAKTGQSCGKLLALAIAGSVSLAAIAMPILISGGDWNGVLQHSFGILVWIVLGASVYFLWPAKCNYSVPGILAVLLISGFTYKAAQTTEIFWAKPLGATDDDVARALETYAVQDASFQLAHHILGNERAMPCGDLCRILRQYTNVRDAEAKTEVRLVDNLQPSTATRPNIFLLVIDSLRPDYLGAYNPKVDFTPNLDAFARESVVLRNVYTQYAGTTLSEPAIWSGAMLLHAHYMRPFSRVNSLEKLLNIDKYQTIVSYDTVLSQILSPSDDLVKLDTDKELWNRFEACSTIQQLETVLDSRSGDKRPVFFYAQPMNVHQFARNDVPGMSAANWQMRQGFSNRIAYEAHYVDSCLGGLFAYLKVRGLYENSVIIVTSDHGDATGEFGRFSHSTSIYPEVMRVPLIVHLPAAMRRRLVYEDSSLSALTDITPSLYYLLGHRPIRANPIFGHPLFTETSQELEIHRREELFLASDERAVYGVLAQNGRYLYTTYDFPAQSFLFDLARDPNAEHNLLTKELERQYGEKVIGYLRDVADYYGYKPGIGALLAAR
jgi:hypothetical protein